MCNPVGRASGSPFIQSLYNQCHSLVCIASSTSGSFPGRVGLSQGCALTPILLITLMDRKSRLNQGVEGMASLLFPDYVVLLASSDHDQQLSLNLFTAECDLNRMSSNLHSPGRGQGPAPSGGLLSILGSCSQIREKLSRNECFIFLTNFWY